MERFFTILWLILIPVQLGRHFWLRESSVMGVRIDYLSIILYLTDIVWLGWVISESSIFNFQSSIKKNKFKIQNLFTFQSLLIVLFVGVNVILAQARWVALYRWLRIGQWWLTWELIRKQKRETRNEMKKVLGWIVPVWIILEAFLGLAQVVNGGSLNGIWWWLGERRFTYGGIGIAQIRFLDEGWIRAYGTFSHPNSLAGFLLLAWWWWRINLPPTPFFDKTGERITSLNKIFYWIVNWSAILGIILSGSRTVWAVTLGLLVAEQFVKNKPPLYSVLKGVSDLDREDKKKYFREILGKGLLFIGIVCLALGVININYRIDDFMGGWDTDSWQKREMLGLTAVKMIENSPLFGIGAGNFIVNLPKFRVGNFYWMQPVHNIFLLVWSEIGALGIVILIFNLQSSIFKIFRKKNWWFLIIVGVTGMVDHYWLTLPQNSWLLAIILGLI